MADDTAAEPLYYIADTDLWFNGPGGNVRAFAAGDHVPPGHVDRFGWQDLVSTPGEDTAPPPPPAPAATRAATTSKPIDDGGQSAEGNTP